MTLTKFMARSTWVAHAFEWKKLLKCHLKGKTSKKLANGQNIDYSEKRKRPKGFICPCTGVKYHNIQTCLLVYAADSGERLQDHWSSGLRRLIKHCIRQVIFEFPSDNCYATAFVLLCSDCETDQRLYFRHTDSKKPLLFK